MRSQHSLSSTFLRSLCALAVLPACSAPVPLDCQVEQAGVGRATVSWSSAQTGVGAVVYGTDGQLQTVARDLRVDLAAGSVDTATGSDQRHLLLGLTPDTDVDWQATWTVDGDSRTCGGTLRTDPLPSWVAVPQIALAGDTGDTGGSSDDGPAGAWLAAVFELGTYTSQILIFDRQGRVRWAQQADDQRFVVDVQPALDGTGLVHDQFHYRFEEDVGLIRRLDWLGQPTAEVPTSMSHHMFAQLPDGGLAFQQLDVRDWTDPDSGQTQAVVGDAIVEVAPDGSQTRVFDAWDWLSVQPNSFSSLPSIYPQGLDWTHGNALKYDEQADTWLLSLGNAGTVMTIDRSTGQSLRTVGAFGLPVAKDSPALEHQHDPTWLSDDTLLVFDSHFDELRSGAFVYQLVEGELHLSWQHQPEDALFALALGQARRTDDGGTWINYGTAGVIEELDADDQQVWRAQAADGHGFAQVMWLPDFPTP